MFKNLYELYDALLVFYTEDIEDKTSKVYQSQHFELPDTLESTSKNSKDGEEFGESRRLYAREAFYIIVLFLAFLTLKKFLVEHVEKSTFINNCLRKKDKKRLIECSWRLTFYAISSLWLYYSCFIKQENDTFSDRTPTEYSIQVSHDEYLINLIELAFYLHATYATIFEDIWRRDSFMMIIHHFAAIVLIFANHLFRAHKIFLPNLFLRDACDVILEITKLSMCFRIQYGKVVKLSENCVKFFMTLLAVAFIFNQLYLYPLYTLFHFLNYVKVNQYDSPLWTTLITCGVLLFVIDIFWFLVILRILYRMFLIDAPLEDIREYKGDEEEQESKCKQNSNGFSKIPKKSSIKQD